MSGLVLHAVVVSVLLGAAALLLEPVLRALRLPTRWIWAAVLVLSVGLAGWGILGPGSWGAVPVETPVASAAGAAGGASSGESRWSAVARGGHEAMVGLGSRMQALVEAPMAIAVARLPTLSPGVRMVMGAAWLAASVLLLGLLTAGTLRHARCRSRWPKTRLFGEEVRLSPGSGRADGPAVAGVWHPEIILPRWTLELPPPQLRLLLRHESQHRSARDPSLLAAGSLLVALCPWNPVLWFQLRRLRDAVEVDCDARVLRSSGARRPYAELLLRAGAIESRRSARSALASSTLAPAAMTPLALGSSRSQLERRFRAMFPSSPRPLPLAAATVAAFLLLVSACMTDQPTAVPPEVSTPEDAAVTETAATLAEEPAARVRIGHSVSGSATSDEPGPLVVVNGTEMPMSAIGVDIDPSTIASIEVLKGAAAESIYGSKGARGVILVTLKNEG
ncbi:hypothetical protein BH23GEM11_BH23GEM11_19990 [soil metagenome]